MPSELPDRDAFGRRMTVFGTPINPEMGEGRWQDALRRMRASIAAGSQLEAVDSREIGDKYTHCSWGMCSGDVVQWPEADDHVFPEDFVKRKRVAPRDAPGECPLDGRARESERNRYGCFHKCLVFGRKTYQEWMALSAKDRDRVLELYDAVITKREAEHGRKTKEDDNEPWAADGK